MRIGYSFWGFLGDGVTDTPDGGRSHRRVLVDALIARGHDVVFLQVDRDRSEAGGDLTATYRWDTGLPDVDALFLEWRWPVEGRNTTPCGTPGHTCDLHRQDELVDHYTRAGTPTVLWDKDLRLPADDPLRGAAAVAVCEAALHPSPGATTLLFPVADAALDAADPTALASVDRDLALSYVGNQYDRDDAFDRFVAPATSTVTHVVAGKWPRTGRWPHAQFVGRIPFAEVARIHRRSLATVTLLPDRYERAGQMTQRLFEAVLAGCLPLVPTTVRSHDRFAPRELLVSSGGDVLAALHRLVAITRSDEHVDLLGRCLAALDQFRASRQIAVLDRILPTPAPATVRGVEG